MSALAAASTGEAVAFWVLGPLSLIAAIAMVLSRSAVHAALWLGGVMLSLAGLYAAQDAPFLAVVQVIVYTGAIMMLFLFVLMLVGVDSSDSLVETLRGHRVLSLLTAVGFAVVLLGAIAAGTPGDVDAGLAEAHEEGNVIGIARLLFTKYVVAFEVTSALLITAALGAMVLAHRERPHDRQSQRELARSRYLFGRANPVPGPGVMANSHSNATPALLPDGRPAEGSVSAALEGPDDAPKVQS